MTEKQLLEQMYLVEMMSIPQIAKRIGKSISCARYRLLKNGIQLRSAAVGVRLAASQGRMSVDTPGRHRPKSESARRKIREAKLRHGELYAKGTSLKQSGYIEITRGANKWRRQHDVIMEEAIGRRLAPDEVVHHINFDKTDNRIQNLQLMTRSEHSKFHRNYGK